MNLFLVDIPWNILNPLVSPSSPKMPLWNREGEDWIVSIFDFVEKFLIANGAMFLFHPNDLRVFKEIMSYLLSYIFQICMKWVVTLVENDHFTTDPCD